MSPLSVAVPPPRLLTLLFSALLGMGGVACRQPMAPVASPAPVPSAASVPTGSQPAVTLWFMTRVQNTPEPCGCTSDPLGDVSRVAALVRASAERGLLLDAGALRYPPTPMPVAKRPQARLKADFLESTWRELGALVRHVIDAAFAPPGAVYRHQLRRHRTLEGDTLFDAPFAPAHAGSFLAASAHSLRPGARSRRIRRPRSERCLRNRSTDTTVPRRKTRAPTQGHRWRGKVWSG